MMQHLPVNWSEGMFLRPQHFQASDRHWSELLATSQHWDNAYNFGIRQLVISDEALGNYQIAISSCQVRMQDGLLLSATSATLDSISLRSAFSDAEDKTSIAAEEVVVYLGVPKLVLGRRNVADTPTENVRYVQLTTKPIADESSGGEGWDVDLRSVNARLMLKKEEGYEVIPLAKIKRSGYQDAIPEVDQDYIPPLISVDAWPGLSQGIIQDIYHILGQNMKFIARRVRQRGINLTSQTPGDLEDLLRLSVINQSYAVLHAIAFADGTHPYSAYTELCRCVGMLSIFGKQRELAEDIPHYDHHNLGPIFRWLKSQIQLLLGKEGVTKANYEQIPFKGVEQSMQVTFKREWLEWDWYIGVLGENITEDEIRDCLKLGVLNWKLGAASRIVQIQDLGIPGVEMKDLRVAPAKLPRNQGWVYYEVFQDENNASWQDVRNETTPTLALRFVTGLIGNLATLTGQEELVVNLPSKQVVLRFALFAVPRSTVTQP